MRGFNFRGVNKAEERRFKQYQIECTLVKVDPSGKDLGADGKGKVLAQPSLIVPEGKESRIFFGGQVAAPTENSKAVEFLDNGLSVRVKILGLTERGVRLEIVLERNEVESADQNGVLVRGNKVRSITCAKLGQDVKVVDKDDRGEARHWVCVNVVKVENVISGTVPAKADSAKRPTFHEVARRLGLSDINSFLFAEAVQGYRDPVPPISDLARDFGMKEIDVYLLQEALHRDIEDQTKPKEEEHMKGNQSGFDYRLPSGAPIAIDFGFPMDKIQADDKQTVSFWAGFFGH